MPKDGEVRYPVEGLNPVEESLEDLKRQRDNLISEVTQGREGGAEDRRRMTEAIEELERKIEELEKKS